MNRTMLVVGSLFATLGLIAPAFAASNCTTIQSGALTDINGNPLGTGYDQWGYNYQAHIFNGLYENFTRPTPGTSSPPLAVPKSHDSPVLDGRSPGSTAGTRMT